jgi:hypothetical protein
MKSSRETFAIFRRADCLHLSGAIQTLGSGTMLSMVAVMS